jgi:hypothetical protein
MVDPVRLAEGIAADRRQGTPAAGEAPRILTPAIARSVVPELSSQVNQAAEVLSTALAPAAALGDIKRCTLARPPIKYPKIKLSPQAGSRSFGDCEALSRPYGDGARSP